MKFTDVETRLRRYLRDPNAKVWSQDLLMDLFNDAQQHFHQDLKMDVVVSAVSVPAQYEWSSTSEWEEDYLEGYTRRAGTSFEASGEVVFFRWEITQIMGDTPQVSDGYRCTHAWEIYQGTVVIIDRDVLPLPYDFDDPLLIAFDGEKLTPIEEREVQASDSRWEYNTGEPWRYYMTGEDQDRRFVMYPRPSGITLPIIENSQINGSFAFDWEEDEINDGYSQLPTADAYTCFHAWETYYVNEGSFPGPEYDSVTIATHLWEVELSDSAVLAGIDGETFEGETGVTGRWDDAILMSDYGVDVDYIPLSNNVLLVYKPRVVDILSGSDDIEHVLDWHVKYIERKVMSLAFMINNDRYSPQMSQFWEGRYMDGIRIMKKYKSKRNMDKRPQLKGKSFSRYNKRLVDLPYPYPSVWS